VGTQRRRDDALVVTHPLHAGEDGPHALAGRDLRGARDEQPGRDEVEVVETTDGAGVLIDEPAESESHRGEEQHGREERREGKPAPKTPVHHPPAFPDAHHGRGRTTHGCSPQSSSVRPVRMRKTSSRLARRTSTESGSKPLRVTASAVASPLCVYTRTRSAKGSTRSPSSTSP